MQNIIINILTVSLSMSLVALLLILLTKPMKRFRASCRYILWLLVIVRLMIPFGGALFPKLFTFPVVQEKTENVSINEENKLTVSDNIAIPDPVYSSKGYGEELYNDNVLSNQDVTSIVRESGLPSESKENVISAETSNAATVTEDGIALIILMVWLCGAGIFFTVALSSYLRNVRIIKRNLSTADVKIQKIYRELCDEMNVRKAPKLYVCPAVRTPMVYGLIRQRVLLPEIPLAETDIRRVLSHELVHHKRHDLKVKFIALTANAFHWFNPMAYIASKRLFEEMELSCDERVLKDADKEERIFYGVAMLEIVKKCRKAAPFLTTGFNPKKKAVIQRFENILDTAKKSRGYSVIALLLCVCILCTSIIGFAKEETDSVPTEEDSMPTLSDTPKESNYKVLGIFGKADDIQPLYDMMDNSMDTLGVSLLTAGNRQYIIDYDGMIRTQLPESEIGFSYCSVCNKITDHNYYVDPESFEAVYEPSGHGGGGGHYIYDIENDLVCYNDIGGYRICDGVDFAIASLSSLADTERTSDMMTSRYVDGTGDFVYTDDGVVFCQDNFISYDDNYYNESGKFGLICNSEPIGDFEHEGYLDFDNYGICALKKNGKWGYFNHKGEMILDYLYEESANWVFDDHAQQIPYSSSSGVIALNRDGKWGYADTEGNILTDFVFEEARPAFNGRSWVKLQGEWCVIAFDNYINTLSPGEAAQLVKPFIENYYSGGRDVDLRILYDEKNINYYGMRCYTFEVQILSSNECYTVAVSHDKAVYIIAPHYIEEVEIG